MRAGVLAVVDGTFNMVDSFTETVSEDDTELARRLEIGRVFSLPDGSMAFAGHAAAERLANQREASIEDDEIHVEEGTEVVTDYTEFVGVTGEFVVVGSGDGEFAFDLVGAETNTDIQRATLDLDGFFASHGSATPWRAGFAGNGDAGMNGVFHGEDLRSSHDLDSLLADSSLNQLGLSYGYDGDQVKMTASRSGYVEVYQPSSYDAATFLTYLREEMLDHVV